MCCWPAKRGVGKSRLAAELRRQATLNQWTILAGHCFERDAVFPYAPIIDGCARLSGYNQTPSWLFDLGCRPRNLVKLLPEFALAIAHLQPIAPSDPETEKRRLFEALVQFFAHLTQTPQQAPLLLILEDLHWCDETSLDFLHLLARPPDRPADPPVGNLSQGRSRAAAAPMVGAVGSRRLSREIILEALPFDAVQHDAPGDF